MANRRGSRIRYAADMLAAAARENATSAPRRRAYLRDLARQPLEAAARASLERLPSVELADLVDLAQVPPMPAARLFGDRGSWSAGATVRLVLDALIRGRGLATVFEIGTFNGGTTRFLAESVPAHSQVVTLDLPVAHFDASQHPPDLAGTQVGSAWHGSHAAGKITQLLADSLTFEPGDYAATFDLVLVDGAHDYEHGLADTRTALQLARPGAVIVFDDFAPYWMGLVRGVIEAAAGQELARLAGTDLGIIASVTPPSRP